MREYLRSLWKRTVDAPLRDLDYVAIDLETTGLHANGGDEIVSMAGVRIVAGEVRRDAAFDRLVDPGRAIPPDISRIHGITDAMVSGRPRVVDVLPAFRAFIGAAATVGYNLSFDLGFLARKRMESGASFDGPSLCILRLSEYLEPRASDHGLEAVAARFGVAITRRHTALGDALAAAEIFVRMIPELEAHGVRTLADAHHAGRRAHFMRRLHLAH